MTDSRGDPGTDLKDRPFRAARSARANCHRAGDDLFDRRRRFHETAGSDDAFQHVDDAAAFAVADDDVGDDSRDQPTDRGKDDDQLDPRAVEELRRHAAIEDVADPVDEFMKAHRRRRSDDADLHREDEQERVVAKSHKRQPARNEHAKPGCNGTGREHGAQNIEDRGSRIEDRNASLPSSILHPQSSI